MRLASSDPAVGRLTRRRFAPDYRMLLIGCLLLSGVTAQFEGNAIDDEPADRYQEFIATEEERGLFPNIFNLATNSLIKATATCGQARREEYCKLVEHIMQSRRPTNLLDSPQCDTCDANDVRHRHPIEFAIDGTKKWWQSPSLYNGLENEKVNITIDLRQVYQVAYVVIKMGNSPRPGTWVLEKSLDGETWQPWQYYATHDAECMRQFGIPATTGVPRFTSDDEVICTSEYSKLQPLEAGEIHTSLVNGRPGVEKPSETLQNFTRTRFVRMRLLNVRTLNADLMVINRRNEHLDRSVTMRYFYSISDVSIGGQCICYGHAESCPPDPITGQFKCECRHNTCGESCNKCCPLFNQLPWKQGTNYQPNICQQCQCFNHADRCEYDEEVALNNWSVTPEGVYEGGGRCVECKHNTAGVNCEKCADGFYRPSGISHYREDACRACDCDAVGSQHTSCIRDDQSARDELHPGDCVCKPGFGGRRCERCARGYRNYPKCEPCPCNKHGSVNFDTCEEESCVCKQNVEGLYCDRCKAGTIHLSEDNPLGCQPCFCFGLTSNCTEQPFITGKISANLGWNLTDRFGARDDRPDAENGDMLLFNSAQNKNGQLYYWKAPANFTGNLLNSYGGVLHYYVYFVPSQEGGDAVPLPDLVIEGNGVKLEYYTRQDFFPRENMTVTIPIREGGNWYNSETRRPITKDDLMRALADVKLFMVRSMYNLKQLQSSISGLQLDTALLLSKDEVKFEQDNEDVLHPHPVDTRMRGVEVCGCPDNYGGRSCESCISGFRRVGNQLHGGQCVKCECEGHSDKCDPWSGACLDCKHNTTGARCELCARGHYGNPSLGGELGTCRPCACPTAANSHSAECALTQLVISGSAAAGADAYVCTACEQGYEGNKCEVCADGYFGDAVNGTCQECACTGNIDLADIGNCDRKTGKCLKCTGHTTGDACEKCEDNHFGSAAAHNCKSCGCHRVGAKQQQCDTNNGICECKDNYIGKHCDRCAEGHGDVDNECPSCECNEMGAIGKDCDDVSGQCTCKQGVFGKRCDQCRPGYYNFTDAGCQFCHCNAHGSKEEGTCDSATGKCACRAHVDGNMCEKCEDGFFNITSGAGCQECNCDKVGAEGVHCDMHSGQCACKPGVAGVKCDACAPNHFGLSKQGCKECPACPAPGQVCDAKTGECVCPPNTVGKMCEACADDAWDYHPLRGCRKCDCSAQGANGTKCDPMTGQCRCKEQYVGLACDHCSHGYFNFPTCEPCDCAVDGTESRECKDGVCLCDENGQCPCKKNADGLKCDQCKPNTFSLDAANALGCTDCFCFNRTDMCVQTSMVWQQIYAEDRVATFAEPWEYYSKKHNLNILKEFPPRFNSYPTDATPLYWPLHKAMLGDRTGSYNGFLRFKIWNDDNRRGLVGVRPDGQYFRYFPQVVLVGNNRMELEHVPWQINDDGKYKVRLHESEWRSRTAPEQPLSRAQMMIALQSVQGIYIRGTYNYPARGDVISISEISLDVAVAETPAAAASALAPSPALGVEQCAACPPGYAGPSCQNPAPGFCRKRHRDFLNSADDMALIGWSEPCACNGHSTTCDAETCLCMDCQHNTQGDWCERCRPGYIGQAENGGPASCTKCACPSVEQSFSDTCKAATSGRGYVCDACKHGYGGEYCEMCLTGYYGNPQVPGGDCRHCECHRDGSVHGACNPLTGQCECLPGVTGRDCSRCQERHAFIGGVCTSCDQGCYLPLMATLDLIEDNLALQNFSALRPIPWKRVARIKDETKFLSNFVAGLVLPSSGEITDAEGKTLDIVQGGQFTREADTVIDEARFDAERVNKSAHSILALTNKTEVALADVQKQFRQAHNTTQFLAHYARHGGEKGVHAEMLDVWRAEAEAHYNATVERGAYIEKRFGRAEDEHKHVEELLKRVLTNKLNDTSFENLNERIGEFAQWLEDYRETLHLGAKKDIGDAVKMAELVVKRIDRYKDVAAQLDSMRGDAQDSLAAATDAIEQTRKKALLGMFDDYRSLNESFPTLKKGVEDCEEMSDKYAQSLDEYDEKFVDPATAHSHKLEADAARITAAFSSTKASAATPIAAAAAYEEIQGALQNATLAADEAEKAAAEALNESDAQIDGTLPAQVVKSLESSGSLSEDAKTLAEEWAASELPKENKDAESLLDKGRSAIAAATNSKNSLKDEWGKFDDYHDRVVGLRETSVTADERSSAARKQGQKLAEKAGDIEKRADKLLNSTGSGIRDEINKMKEVRASLAAKMGMASKQLGGDGETTAEREKRLAAFQDRIALLKDRLGEAREKAEQIRIALHGSETGKCRRSFPSASSPSPSTSIQLRFRPLRAVPDSLLLLTKTTAKRTVPSEYVALEVVAQRVVAHWNIGAGQKKVTNSYPINYIPSSADRNTWYTINLERAGNAVNLTVSLREGAAGTPAPVTVTLPKGDEDGDDVIFNTVPGDTQVSIGSEPAVINGLGLATNEFRGTIGTVTIDGVPMSLWTFSYTTKECTGETAPSPAAVRGHMFRNGFASMRTLVPQERTTTSITVTFAAFSPNGLLYFRGSQSADADFVSVYFKDGKVVFTINLGRSTSATIESMRTYDDGLQHTVKAVRGPDGVYLQVDSDEDRQQSFLTGGEATALNIDHDEHFVGGVPAEFERKAFDSFDIQWRGFFGCILSVKPNQVTELDIENAHRSFRKEPGCMFSAPSTSSSSEKLVPSDRIVGFGKAGFLITQGVTIDGNTNFGFGFRSKEENGTLLFQSSKLAAFRRKQKRDDAANGQGYMAFYLFRGYLVCHFGKDASRRDGVVTIRSTSPYNDGLMHSVFFERSGKRVRVRVDDREIGAEDMGDESSIGRAGVQLFVGGFPERTKPPGDEIPTAVPLVGCVSDLSLNFRPLQMVPEDHEATLGGCPMQAAPISPIGEEIAHPDGETASFARQAQKLSLVMEKNVAVEDVEELYYEVEKDKKEKDKKPVSAQCGGGFANAHFDGEEGDALRYGIGQSTHGRINFLDKEQYPNISGFTFALSFRTESPHGMLWIWANYKEFTRYFLLHVNEGLLQLDVKGHRDPKTVVLNERRVDDGQWHDVKLVREEKTIKIELDGVLAGTMTDAPIPKVMRKRMFVGGVISRHRKTFPAVPVGWNGCIRSIIVNGAPQRFDESTSKDLVPCAPATTKALYAHDGGYASFDSSKTRHGIYPSEELSVQVDFRNMQQDGLVFAVLSSNSLDEKRLTAIMKGGQIYMTLVYKAEGIDLRDVPIEREEGELCNGKWHRIAVSVEATRLVVAIDEQSSEIPLVISSAARKSLAGLSLYVGGPSSEVANELSVFSLVGCYSDLRFGDKTLYFEEASKINRAIVDGCPFGRDTALMLR
ncbi:lam-3 [Pristionchus pacificus]|nr:lam-3 [Pristionchus pacificus]